MTKINLYSLKNQLNELLKAGKKITIEFNCGNDEAHIVPFIDDIMLEYGQLHSDLEEYIFIDLNLPSAGEYMVTGSGYLKLEDDDIILYYDLEGFTNLWDEEDDICNSESNEPQNSITEKRKEKWLLLSSEYDDPEKLKLYLDSEASKHTDVLIQNNFSPADKVIWDSLADEKPKPWWKFW